MTGVSRMYLTCPVGILFGLTMFMVSIALVMSVIVTNIFLRKDSGRRVPGWLRRASRIGSLSRIKDERVDHAAAEVIRSNDLDLDDCEEDATRDFRQNCRTGSWVYSGHRRHVLPPEVTTVKTRASTTAEAEQKTASSRGGAEAPGDEWRRLAKRVDRIFFWVFVAASVGALLAMFLSLPHHNLM